MTQVHFHCSNGQRDEVFALPFKALIGRLH